jgi:hypothetical protein
MSVQASAADERTQHSDGRALSSGDGLSYIPEAHLRTADNRPLKRVTLRCPFVVTATGASQMATAQDGG